MDIGQERYEVFDDIYWFFLPHDLCNKAHGGCLVLGCWMLLIKAILRRHVVSPVNNIKYKLLIKQLDNPLIIKIDGQKKRQI